MIDSGFFTTARYVPEQKFKLKKGNALDNTSSEKEIKSVIENISKTFENWLDEDITKFEEIYVASDQHSLGIYLTSKVFPIIILKMQAECFRNSQDIFQLPKATI